MNNLNSILVEGNLVRDPELSYTSKGSAVCKFTVACNRFFKQGEETQKEVSCFDVSCWTRLAEVCGESLLRGRGVRVVGRLKQDHWTGADGKDGEGAAAEGQAADGQAQEEAELKEAASIREHSSGREAGHRACPSRCPCQ